MATPMRPKHMFGPIVRAQQADMDDAADRRRRVDEADARLDEPLTRREVLDALETVACDYGGNGNHDSDLIAEAFRKLKEALS